MTLWEYKVIKIGARDKPQAVYILNGWGRGGWELVSVVYDVDRDVDRVYMKRQYAL